MGKAEGKVTISGGVGYEGRQSYFARIVKVFFEAKGAPHVFDMTNGKVYSK